MALPLTRLLGVSLSKVYGWQKHGGGGTTTGGNTGGGGTTPPPPPPPPTPGSYTVASSSYNVAAGATVTISAQLRDTTGAILATSGRVVTWSSSNGGSFSTATSTTNSAGVASVSFTVSATGSITHIVTATDSGGIIGHSSEIIVAPAAGGGTGGGGGSPDALIQVLIDGELDGGSADLYHGTPPRSTLDSVNGAMLLASFPFHTPSAPLGNLVASNQITTVQDTSFGFVADTAVPKFLRIRRSDGSVIADVRVDLSGTPITISSNTVIVGQEYTLTLLVTA